MIPRPQQLVLDVAVAAAPGLAPRERADLYAGLAALFVHAPDIASEAAAVAAALREAEQKQLLFARLMSAAVNPSVL